MEKRVASLAELEQEAGRFIDALPAASAGATLITLSGELGAGKTAFTQAVARRLGVRQPVQSPTFVLEKIYQLQEGGRFERLIHIDAYRLESGAELGALGFDELMRGAGNLILLEWPEKVAGRLPHAAVRVSLSVHADGSRTLAYNHGDS